MPPACRSTCNGLHRAPFEILHLATRDASTSNVLLKAKHGTLICFRYFCPGCAACAPSMVIDGGACSLPEHKHCIAKAVCDVVMNCTLFLREHPVLSTNSTRTATLCACILNRWTLVALLQQLGPSAPLSNIPYKFCKSTELSPDSLERELTVLHHLMPQCHSCEVSGICCLPAQTLRPSSTIA